MVQLAEKNPKIFSLGFHQTADLGNLYPQLRYQAIENDSSAGFLESDAFMTGGQSRFGVSSTCLFAEVSI